jgi:hypothetical protein
MYKIRTENIVMLDAIWDLTYTEALKQALLLW